VSVASAHPVSQLTRELEAAAARLRAGELVEESLALLDALLSTAPAEFALLDQRLGYARISAALHVSAAVALVAADGTIVAASPAMARILGYPADELVGRSARELIHPDDQERAAALLAALVQTPGAGAPPHWWAESRMRCRDGTWRWMEGAGTNLLAEPSVQALAITYRDVTERKRAEEERAQVLAREQAARAAAEAAVRARDELLAVAAHELRTPMTTLWGYTQFALRRLRRTRVPRRAALDRQRGREILRNIDAQAEKVNRLVDQLLDVSRLGAEKLVLERSATDLTRLVHEVVAAAQATTGQHRLVVHGRLSLPVLVEPLRFEQVLANLLHNAIKYSPDGGRIEVELAEVLPDGRAPGTVRLAVRDHGVGIPPEHRPLIFDRYYQAHGEGHLRGLGLGLYVSRQIVELHGGRLTVEFPDDGGTRFVVTLPAAGSGQEPVPPPPN
jgi:PAS domain S-box-containing protein